MKAIVVGSAASLLKTKAGEKIDSFDYVIRPVTSLLASGYEDYTGIKTDMFWVTFQYLVRLSLIHNPVDLLCVFSSDDHYTELPSQYKTVPTKYIENRIYFDRFIEQHRTCFKKISFINNKLIPHVNTELGFKHPHTLYQENKLRAAATSGINTLYYVLNCMHFDQVYVTGFDFYQTGFYWQPNVKEVSIRPFPYKEMIYYNKLIKEKKIYEL